METYSALLAIRVGNSQVPGEFPAQRPVTRSFNVFFDLRLNKWLSKQSWGWRFETLSCPLWRHCNANYSFKCALWLFQWPHNIKSDADVWWNLGKSRDILSVNDQDRHWRLPRSSLAVTCRVRLSWLWAIGPLSWYSSRASVRCLGID